MGYDHDQKTGTEIYYPGRLPQKRSLGRLPAARTTHCGRQGVELLIGKAKVHRRGMRWLERRLVAVAEGA